MPLSEKAQAVLAEITAALPASDLTTLFVTNILIRLESFGYTFQERDGIILVFTVQKTENTVKNTCNTQNIPSSLNNAAVDLTCGEFLLTKKSLGQLQGLNVDLTPVIKQIQVGDTSTTLALSEGCVPPEKRLDILINYLINDSKKQFISERRLKW
jgi:hypothetical protein